MFNFWDIFKHALKIYGIWPQANKYITNTLPQCSLASVGLTQARPNYYVYILCVYRVYVQSVVKDMYLFLWTPPSPSSLSLTTGVYPQWPALSEREKGAAHGQKQVLWWT